MRNLDAVLYLRGYRGSDWSTARLVAAVPGTTWTVEDAVERGICGRRVFSWHPAFWDGTPRPDRASSRVLCVFHHYVFDYFSQPEIIAGLAYNGTTAELLRRADPCKPVRRVDLGGAEDAVPHARRRLATRRIRILIVGNAHAPSCDELDRSINRERSRKGVELIAPLARRLDLHRYAWIFVGKHWGPHAEALESDGWTVAYPGPLPSPGHYTWMGEGDIFLMLSRVEGGPLPLLESMGLGIWPISTTVGVAPDVIHPGLNGHLVEVRPLDDIEGAADELAALIRSIDREYLAGAKTAVAESVRASTWSRFGTQVRDAIEEFLA